MENQLNSAAPHHLPFFITAPGTADVLYNIVIVILLVAVLIVGNLYLRLHALPERMSHRANQVQLEVVAVLALLALFTHNNLLWVAALLLAMIRFPDFEAPLASIARSLRVLTGERAAAPQPDPPAPPEPAAAAAPQEDRG